MARFELLGTGLVAALCAISGCSKGSAPGASGGSANAWVANGAIACDKYLSQDVVAAIITNPGGTTKTLSLQACSYAPADGGGTITITLSNAGPAAFDAYQKYLVGPVQLPGVGDKASQSLIGIIAVKDADRTCSIDAGGAPGWLKLHGEELGKNSVQSAISCSPYHDTNGDRSVARTNRRSDVNSSS